MGYEIRWVPEFAAGTDDDVVVELPGVVWWNLDRFMMTFVRDGLEKLLNGHTAWSDDDRHRLVTAQEYASTYLSHAYAPTAAFAGKACLDIIGDMLPRLWD